MAGPSDKFVDTPDAVDSAEYQAFLDDFSHQLTPSEGEILHGHVLSVSEKEVIVDIGRKIEGLVPASQFPLIEGKPAVRTGDEIEVMIDRRGEPVEGYILLSYERPHRLHVWEHLEKAAGSTTNVAEAHRLLIQAYYDTRRYEQAWQSLRRAQDLGFDFPDLLAALQKAKQQSQR